MKKKSFLKVLSAAFAVLTLAGCAEPVVFGEVFQLKVGEKLYTKYNLWYENPEKISCLNIQQGSFIPLGTEIEPVGTSSFGGKIIFKDKKGQQYTIRFDSGYRLCSMRDFIAYTFTKETAEEQLRDVPEKIRTRILRGEVVPGMNQQQVLLAYGPPPAIRTPNLRNETWFYFVSPSETIRVIFRGDRVRTILNVNQAK